MNNFIFIFIDGVGIGEPVPTNPFYSAGAAYLPCYKGGCQLPDGSPIKAIDACLGIEGMPMSATGQSTLFTGTNVPLLLGEHRESYPDAVMRKVIKEQNIFAALKKNKLRPRFLNAYPGTSYLYTPFHIRLLDNGEFRISQEFQSRVTRSISVTTCMLIANFMVPFGQEDIIKEKALFHDYSNQSLNTNPHKKFPVFSPVKAAEIIYKTAQKYDFLLYEYFQTDLFGHGFEVEDCKQLVRKLDCLIGHLISLIDKENDTLLITSDHGNLEDCTTPFHTTNPVPLILYGKHSQKLYNRINNLADVSPAIMEMFLEPDYPEILGGSYSLSGSTG